jgi:predicted acyltransferase
MLESRNESLDILRGLAIVGMVLSGSIAHGGILPAWMYHAQVPPPAHKFVPTLAGITWVDLVFPFFLFAMGAAIPLAFARREKDTPRQIFISIAKRALLLAWFAVFLQHFKPHVLAAQPSAYHAFLALLGFALLWLMYCPMTSLFPAYSKAPRQMRIGAFIISGILAASFIYADGTGFRLTRNDIIILVLANMAFWGGIIYWLSKDSPYGRLAILPFLMALILTNSPHGVGGTEGWQMDMTKAQLPEPFKALYHFNFLKYLFIVLPATYAGEWILAEKKSGQKTIYTKETDGIAVLSISLVPLNLWGLFSRQVQLNLVFSLLMLAALFFLIQKKGSTLSAFIQKSAKAGAYLLLLGLTFETLQGGIKKDNATLSYFFVTAGLAFFLLIAFDLLKNAALLSNPQYSFVNRTPFLRRGMKGLLAERGVFFYLKTMGQNPMLAYVAGSLCLTPILMLSHLDTYWGLLNISAPLGFLKGVIYTSLVAALTIWASRKGWFWKT